MKNTWHIAVISIILIIIAKSYSQDQPQTESTPQTEPKPTPPEPSEPTCATKKRATTEPWTYPTYPAFVYPSFQTYPTYPPPPTTTPWTIAFSTVPARNSTLGANSDIHYNPTPIYGFELVRGKQCALDEYYQSFRYLTEVNVCAEWCRRESSCSGFTASIYSGACEAFTKCNEVDDEGWVVFYRQAVPTTTRLWAGTTPSPDNFINLPLISNISTILPVIQNHFSGYGNILRTVFNASNGTANQTLERYPRTKLTMSQSIIFKRTLEMAWKARIMFGYDPVEGWVTDVPPPPVDAPSSNTPPPPGSGRKYKCNQGTVDAACELLKMNNEGMLFLFPWLWEGLHTRQLPETPVPDSVSPLFSIVALCTGEAPPTYTNELVCPDPSMLHAIGALAFSVFNTYSEPLYVATLIGSPSYQNEDGLPSVTHYYGSGVDFLCGMAVYGANERGYDESCRLMMRLLRRPEFGRATPCDDVFMAYHHPFIGCGEEWWPVPTVHCDKTIIGSKKK